MKTSKSKLTASQETDDHIPSPSSTQRSPRRKSLSPDQQKLITQKLDAALYKSQELGATQSSSPVRWLRSIQDRKKTKSLDDTMKMDQLSGSNLKNQPTEKSSTKPDVADTEIPTMTGADQKIHSPDPKTCKPPTSDQTTTDAKQNGLQLSNNQPKTDSDRNKPELKKASPTKKSPGRVEVQHLLSISSCYLHIAPVVILFIKTPV